MQGSITKTKIYSVEWDDRIFFLSLNLNEKGIVTNHYRPPDLEKILRDDKFKSEKKEEEFLSVWTKYIIGLSVCSGEKDIIEKNIGALTFIVMDSTINNHTITFYELLTYMDCFSMMLNEQGFSEDKIRNLYLPVVKALLFNFKDKIIDTETGREFFSTLKYEKIINLMEEKY